VDATIRRLTDDKKSMNDFCKIFHGGPGGEPALKTYTFEDVVATLNDLAPFDWTGFLRARLDGLAPSTPTEAIENSGWKLVYNEQENEIETVRGAMKRWVDLSYSIGLTVLEDGTVVDVVHGGPTYAAGFGPGMKIAAVNGKQYDETGLKMAVGGGDEQRPDSVAHRQRRAVPDVLRGLSRRIAVPAPGAGRRPQGLFARDFCAAGKIKRRRAAGGSARGNIVCMPALPYARNFASGSQ